MEGNQIMSVKKFTEEIVQLSSATNGNMCPRVIIYRMTDKMIERHTRKQLRRRSSSVSDDDEWDTSASDAASEEMSTVVKNDVADDKYIPRGTEGKSLDDDFMYQSESSDSLPDLCDPSWSRDSPKKKKFTKKIKKNTPKKEKKKQKNKDFKKKRETALMKSAKRALEMRKRMIPVLSEDQKRKTSIAKERHLRPSSPASVGRRFGMDSFPSNITSPPKSTILIDPNQTPIEKLVAASANKIMNTLASKKCSSPEPEFSPQIQSIQSLSSTADNKALYSSDFPLDDKKDNRESTTICSLGDPHLSDSPDSDQTVIFEDSEELPTSKVSEIPSVKRKSELIDSGKETNKVKRHKSNRDKTETKKMRKPMVSIPSVDLSTSAETSARGGKGKTTNAPQLFSAPAPVKMSSLIHTDIGEESRTTRNDNGDDDNSASTHQVFIETEEQSMVLPQSRSEIIDGNGPLDLDVGKKSLESLIEIKGKRQILPSDERISMLNIESAKNCECSVNIKRIKEVLPNLEKEVQLMQEKLQRLREELADWETKKQQSDEALFKIIHGPDSQNIGADQSALSQSGGNWAVSVSPVGVPSVPVVLKQNASSPSLSAMISTAPSKKISLIPAASIMNFGNTCNSSESAQIETPSSPAHVVAAQILQEASQAQSNHSVLLQRGDAATPHAPSPTTANTAAIESSVGQLVPVNAAAIVPQWSSISPSELTLIQQQQGVHIRMPIMTPSQNTSVQAPFQGPVPHYPPPPYRPPLEGSYVARQHMTPQMTAVNWPVQIQPDPNRSEQHSNSSPQQMIQLQHNYQTQYNKQKQQPVQKKQLKHGQGSQNVPTVMSPQPTMGTMHGVAATQDVILSSDNQTQNPLLNQMLNKGRVMQSSEPSKNMNPPRSSPVMSVAANSAGTSKSKKHQSHLLVNSVPTPAVKTIAINKAKPQDTTPGFPDRGPGVDIASEQMMYSRRPSPSCFICGSQGNLTCCDNIVYCSSKCQIDDWSRHESECTSAKK